MKTKETSGDTILASIIVFVLFLALAGMTGCVYQIWTL